MGEEYIIGQVKRILHQSENFIVMIVQVKETSIPNFKDTVTVTGGGMDVTIGTDYLFKGDITVHQKYGQQFKALTFEKVKPKSKTGVINFLSGSFFPGIGRKTAEKIYDILGKDTISKINVDENVLDQVPKLTHKQKETIISGIKENYGYEKVMLELTEAGLPESIIYALYRKFGDEAVQRVKDNIYTLIFQFKRIDFELADRVGFNYGIIANDFRRLSVGLIYTMNVECQRLGNTYLYRDELLKGTTKLLDRLRTSHTQCDQALVESINEQDLEETLDACIQEGYFVQIEDKIFLKEMDYAEQTVAQKIKGLMDTTIGNYQESELCAALKEVESSLGITYGNSQRQVLMNAIQSPVFVLTGGPGTGKTTVVKGLIHLYAKLNRLSLDPRDYENNAFPIHLAAPTGRAAKRMMEATELPASTIHRLLGLGIDDDTSMMNEESDYWSEKKTIDEGLLIIDEFSMVDTFLAASLFDAISTGVQVIIVGDKDQLPSVRAGQILADLLSVQSIPQGELTDIYRQGKDSSIIQLAHAISQGQLPDNFEERQSDYSFFASTPNNLSPLIEKVMMIYAQKGYDAKQIQVLAPKYKGAGGIDALNKMIQAILNPPTTSKKEVKPFKNDDLIYRLHDKVLFLVNDTTKNVFNGDMGFITGIEYGKDRSDKTDTLFIDFDGNEIELPRNEWSNITLAYCCSIHKSQGSEFPIVIMPMLSEYGIMLQRNLLYTGVTRAKQALILLGEHQAFLRSACTKPAHRQTYLAQRLLQILDEPTVSVEKKQGATYHVDDESLASKDKIDFQVQELGASSFELTLENALSGEINPMIGMDELTPESFL